MTDYSDPRLTSRLPLLAAASTHIGWTADAMNRSAVEQKTSAEALQESQNKFSAIIESAMDAIITADEKHGIVQFNPAAERMFGLTAAAAVGRNLNELLPPRFRGAHVQQVRQFGETNATRRHLGSGECLFAQRADGTEFPVEIAISQTRVEGRRLFTAIVRDITERKTAERNLAATLEELARSNQDLEQFAYVASHDLQEPLRMVSAYTQLLAERYRGKLDENADKYVGYVVEGATRMQALIQDLLTFSRVGRNGQQHQNVDCGAVIDEAARNLTAAIEACEAILKRGPLPMVSGDRSQLVQLFQNMIGNAIKFRGEQRPIITISAERNGDDWTFAVADNGIGIAPEHRERIFVIFQRLHTRAEYPGNGIGLSICKRIVEQHGGRIWVESEAGLGTTFKFTLCAAEGSLKTNRRSDRGHAAGA